MHRVPGHQRARLRNHQQLGLAQHALKRQRAQVHQRLHCLDGRGGFIGLVRLEIAGEDRRPALLLAQEDELLGLGDGVHVVDRKPVQLRRGAVLRRDNRRAQVEQRQHLGFGVRAGGAHEGRVGTPVALAFEAGLRTDLGRCQ